MRKGTSNASIVRPFLRRPRKRWDDWLTFERGSKVEEYRRGRLALIFTVTLPIVSIRQSDFAGPVHVEDGSPNRTVFHHPSRRTSVNCISSNTGIRTSCFLL